MTLRDLSSYNFQSWHMHLLKTLSIIMGFERCEECTCIGFMNNKCFFCIQFLDCRTTLNLHAIYPKIGNQTDIVLYLKYF